MGDNQLNNTDRIGKLADQVDNLIAATEIPMPPIFHLKNLVVELNKVSVELKDIYYSITGENPWKEF